MRRSSVKKLQTAVLILQGVAFALVGLVTVFQEPLKELTGMPSGLEDLFSIPIEHLLRMIFYMILYVAAFFVFAKTPLEGKGMKAGILIGILYIGQIALSGCGYIIMQLVARQGSMIYANYVTVNSLVTTVTSPIAGLASILFCFTCGGYVGCKDNMPEQEHKEEINTYMYGE